MKYALIGCGRIATNHIKAVLNNNLEMVAVCGLLPEAMLLQPGDQPLAEYPGNTKCCHHCSDDLNCHGYISSVFSVCFLMMLFSISDSGLGFNHFRNGRVRLFRMSFFIHVSRALLPCVVIARIKKCRRSSNSPFRPHSPYGSSDDRQHDCCGRRRRQGLYRRNLPAGAAQCIGCSYAGIP